MHIGEVMIWHSCPVCRRAGGAFAISEPNGPIAHLCSIECAKVYIMRKPQPLDFNEKAACLAGGSAAGAYLESIRKTDLATMTEAEWSTFCETLFRETCNDLRRQADDIIPF